MKPLALALLCSTLGSPQNRPAAPSSPAAQNAPAASIDPVFAAGIRNLMELEGIRQLMHQQLDSNVESMTAILKKNPSLSPQFVDALMSRAKEKFNDAKVEDMVVRIYSKFLTRDDIQQLIAFDESPVGQKVRQATPHIMTEISNQLRDYGEQAGREAEREVLKEHPEYQKKPASQ